MKLVSYLKYQGLICLLYCLSRVLEALKNEIPDILVSDIVILFSLLYCLSRVGCNRQNLADQTIAFVHGYHKLDLCSVVQRYILSKNLTYQDIVMMLICYVMFIQSWLRETELGRPTKQLPLPQSTRLDNLIKIPGLQVIKSANF